MSFAQSSCFSSLEETAGGDARGLRSGSCDSVVVVSASSVSLHHRRTDEELHAFYFGDMAAGVSAEAAKADEARKARKPEEARYRAFVEEAATSERMALFSILAAAGQVPRPPATSSGSSSRVIGSGSGDSQASRQYRAGAWFGGSGAAAAEEADDGEEEFDLDAIAELAAAQHLTMWGKEEEVVLSSRQSRNTDTSPERAWPPAPLGSQEAGSLDSLFWAADARLSLAPLQQLPSGLSRPPPLAPLPPSPPSRPKPRPDSYAAASISEAPDRDAAATVPHGAASLAACFSEARPWPAAGLDVVRDAAPACGGAQGPSDRDAAAAAPDGAASLAACFSESAARTTAGLEVVRGAGPACGGAQEPSDRDAAATTLNGAASLSSCFSESGARSAAGLETGGAAASAVHTSAVHAGVYGGARGPPEASAPPMFDDGAAARVAAAATAPRVAAVEQGVAAAVRDDDGLALVVAEAVSAEAAREALLAASSATVALAPTGAAPIAATVDGRVSGAGVAAPAVVAPGSAVGDAVWARELAEVDEAAPGAVMDAAVADPRMLALAYEAAAALVHTDNTGNGGAGTEEDLSELASNHAAGVPNGDGGVGDGGLANAVPGGHAVASQSRDGRGEADGQSGGGGSEAYTPSGIGAEAWLHRIHSSDEQSLELLRLDSEALGVLPSASDAVPLVAATPPAVEPIEGVTADSGDVELRALEEDDAWVAKKGSRSLRKGWAAFSYDAELLDSLQAQHEARRGGRALLVAWLVWRREARQARAARRRGEQPSPASPG